uniref:Uncharacterized protein n=1 Tax=Sciurus vulgaris TaxID=55149 RepID=A0A8D2JQD2_SCIVU
MATCHWSPTLIFPSAVCFCFPNTMSHTTVCVTTHIHIIHVALTFVLYFFLDFIKKQNKTKKAPVICTFSQSFNLLYGNQNYCKKNKYTIALRLWF